MSDESRICTALRVDGRPCQARATYDGHCFMHSADHQLQAALARSAGGKARSRPEPTEKPDLSTPEKQREYLEDTVFRVSNGLLPLNIGRFCVYAVSVVRAVGEDELLKRIEALEEQANADRYQETARGA